MSIFVNKPSVKIPSEMLEPNVIECIGDWIEMLAEGYLTVEQIKERITGLWWIASKSKAIHCELVINQFEKMFNNLSQTEAKELADKVFKDLFAEAKK